MPLESASSAHQLATALSHEPLSRRHPLPVWLRFLLAALVVAAATALRIALDPWVGPSIIMYLPFYAAIAVVALLWGRNPGIFATLLGALSCDFFLISPRFSFRLTDPTDAISLALFLATGLIVSFLAERLHAARHLAHERHQLLAVIFASIGDGIIVTDARGRVAFLNRIAEQLTGWSTDDARGRPLADIFHIINESTRLPVDNPVEKVLRTGIVAGLANHTVLLSRDGREVPIDDSGAPIRQPDGSIRGVVLIFRDISLRRAAELDRARHAEALGRLNATLEERVAERTGQLAAANVDLQDRMDAYRRLETEVARLVEDDRLHLGMELHDNICQQLAAAAIQTSNLARRLRALEPSLADTAARIAATLARAGGDAQTMARGLLPVQVQADGLMTSLAGLAQRTQDSSGVACTFQCAAPVPLHDNATATHLFRIAQEAVHNALKHGQARHIVLSLANDGHVTLAITDDGIGIPPSDKRSPGAGLRIMAYRARIIGADLRIDPAPNGGTLVQCTLKDGASAP
jgi:PAS domain S-box-containing protein